MVNPGTRSSHQAYPTAAGAASSGRAHSSGVARYRHPKPTSATNPSVIGALFPTKPANLLYFTRAGHAYFHGKTEAPPLRANTVLAVGNRKLYMDDFGVRIQDTLVVTAGEPVVLTDYARRLL